MTIDDKIRDEKLQYHINRERIKISAFSAEKAYKHEYLTAREKLPSHKRQVIKQTKFVYS